MFYPYKEKQTLIQFLLNTFDWRTWKHQYDKCECCWQYIGKKLLWIPLAGCPYHD
jgi:hypothetical protein